jgi:5'-nucleotidase
MKPLILVTNDDGIAAPGIKALIKVAAQLGDVLVVAPDSPQSGQGHAITLEHPLRLYPVDIFPGIEAYECSGTPVDCVKMAKHVVAKGRKIELCLSGINHGSNSSINIIYSGTMSAAMEASIEKIPSIGFSLLDYSMEADFTTAKHFAKKIATNVLKHGMKDTLLLNVNIPKLPVEQIKGIKVCRQAEGHWAEEFIPNTDPSGRKYFWLSGKFTYEDTGEDNDIWALSNGYVSVVPSMHDLTAHTAIPSMSYLNQ